MYEYKLSVVIVNYNVKDLLEQCLYSVKVAVSGMEVEIIVVDNHSEDDSVKYLTPLFPDVQFIENSENVGFSKANNQAIRQSKGEYILLLNPDTVVGEDSIRTLCYFMDEHPKAGGVGIKMINGHGVFLPESKRCFPSVWVSFCRLSGLSGLFPQSRTFSKYNLPYLDSNKQHKIEILAGAFMLVRSEALKKIGLLDESFFMYGEDIDLSYRLIQAGYKNYYIPERMLHYKGESSKQNDKRYLRSFYGAMTIFYKKYYPRSGWLASSIIAFGTLFGRFFSSMNRLIRGKSRKRSKHTRLLIICRESNFEQIKAICVNQMPGLEFVNLWDLNENRVMDAICRRNQMKAFTDIVFCYPDVRFEQVLLFMDTMINKKTNYHIYHTVNNKLISSRD